MPGVNGYDLCRRMRAARPQTPIVFITAKSEEMDKVLGLELGADDFIVKPFGLKEVVARIRAVTRRCRQSAALPDPPPFQMGDLTVYPAELRARRGGETIELSLRDVKVAGAAAFLSRAGAGPQHDLQPLLGRGLFPQQPLAGSAYLPVAETDRDRSQVAGHHPHRPRRRISLRRLTGGCQLFIGAPTSCEQLAALFASVPTSMRKPLSRPEQDEHGTSQTSIRHHPRLRSAMSDMRLLPFTPAASQCAMSRPRDAT